MLFHGVLPAARCSRALHRVQRDAGGAGAAGGSRARCRNHFASKITVGRLCEPGNRCRRRGARDTPRIAKTKNQLGRASPRQSIIKRPPALTRIIHEAPTATAYLLDLVILRGQGISAKQSYRSVRRSVHVRRSYRAGGKGAYTPARALVLCITACRVSIHAHPQYQM